MRRPILTYAACLAAAVPTAAARGDSFPPTPQTAEPQIFSQSGVPDVVGGGIPVYAECTAAPIGATECTVRLVLEVEGETVLDVVRTIPVNDVGIEERADVRKVRDRVMKAGGRRLAARLRVYAPDGTLVSDTKRTEDLFTFKPTAKFMDCGVPLFAPMQGGPVTATLGDERFALADEVPAYLPVVVGAAPVTVKANGLTYAFGAGARFVLSCSSTYSVAHGRPYPSLMLDAGEVRVSGTPSGKRQPAAAVVVREAGFNSKMHEHVEFKVTRDPKTRIDTVRVTDGTITARHLFASGLEFPCTTGRTIRVGPHGLLH